MHTNAYGGEGGSEHDQKYAFVCRFIENAVISETFNPLRARDALRQHFRVILCT